MPFTLFCYLTVIENTSKLELGSHYKNVPGLAIWSGQLRAEDYPLLLTNFLHEQDFNLPIGGKCAFWFEGSKNSEVEKGFVTLELDCQITKIPLLALWGLLLVICEEIIELNNESSATGIDQDSFEAVRPQLATLVPRIQYKIERDAYEGELTFSRIPWSIETGKTFARRSYLESKVPWLPYLSIINLFELITECASSIILGQKYHPRTSGKVEVPLSFQAEFVEILKLARAWGESVPPAIYDTNLNRTSKTTIIIESYHKLLDYVDLRLLPEDGEQRKADIMESIPFSVDWFHNVGAKIPKGFQIHPFMEFLEEEWRSSPLPERGSRWVDYEHWEIELIFGYIDIERMGYIGILNIFEMDESDSSQES